MSQAPSPEKIRLTLPSNVDCVRPVHAFVHEIAAHGGMDGDRAHDFALAVEEALVNAIEHGNRGDRGKQVEVEIGCDPREIAVRVTDQGEGFRLEDVPDPTAPENLERASGRGILFMRAFADEVAFEPSGGHGTTVVLRKRFETDGAGSAEPAGDESRPIADEVVPAPLPAVSHPARKKRRKK
jgi:serine/threonine-protein kinase RsbW